MTTDLAYLKRLCGASGDCIVQTNDITKVLADLKAGETFTAPATRLRTIWDRASVFGLLGTLFAADWWLRRR